MQYIEVAVAVGEMFICSKIGAKSLGDGSHDIRKLLESNLGSVAGFRALTIEKKAFFDLLVTLLFVVTN